MVKRWSINLLVIIFFLLFLISFVVFFTKNVSAFDCSNGGDGCLSYSCLTDGSCYQGSCSYGVCYPDCQVSTQETDCNDNDPSTTDTCTNYVCYNTPSFSANGVCEYGAGERLTDSKTDSDDCDQDNDGLFDHCGIGNKVTNENCKGVVSGTDKPDLCPRSSPYPNGVSVDRYGCSCDQKQHGSYTGVSECHQVSCNYDTECASSNPTATCTDSHPECYEESELDCSSITKKDRGQANNPSHLSSPD